MTTSGFCARLVGWLSFAPELITRTRFAKPTSKHINKNQNRCSTLTRPDAVATCATCAPLPGHMSFGKKGPHASVLVTTKRASLYRKYAAAYNRTNARDQRCHHCAGPLPPHHFTANQAPSTDGLSSHLGKFVVPSSRVQTAHNLNWMNTIVKKKRATLCIEQCKSTISSVTSAHTIEVPSAFKSSASKSRSSNVFRSSSGPAVIRREL